MWATSIGKSRRKIWRTTCVWSWQAKHLQNATWHANTSAHTCDNFLMSDDSYNIFFVTSENAIVIMHAPCEEHMKSAGDVVRVRNPCNTGLISLLLLDATRTDGTVLSCGDFGSTRPRSSQMALADPRALVSSILTRLRRGLVLQKLTTRFESLWDMSTKSDDILVCQDANAAIAKLNDSMLGERMIFVREEWNLEMVILAVVLRVGYHVETLNW